MDLNVLKEWSGWLAAAFVGIRGFSNGRIDERIDLRVAPDQIHEALERIETKLDRVDERTFDMAHRVSRLEGALERD
jgi:hypothetical protein